MWTDSDMKRCTILTDVVVVVVVGGLLRGRSDENGSKNWRGLWIEDWAAAGAKGEWLKVNAGRLRGAAAHFSGLVGALGASEVAETNLCSHIGYIRSIPLSRSLPINPSDPQPRISQIPQTHKHLQSSVSPRRDLQRLVSPLYASSRFSMRRCGPVQMI